MKKPFFFTVLFLATINLMAQKLSKEEKNKIKFCKDMTYTIEDPFSGEQIVITKFAEIFGFREEFVRLGSELYASARQQAGKTTLIIKLSMSGARNGETEKGTAHQFSLDLNGNTEVIELKTSENSIAVAKTIGNQYGVSTKTDFSFKYVLSNEEYKILTSGFLKGFKLKLDGNEVTYVANNPEGVLLLKKVMQCLD